MPTPEQLDLAERPHNNQNLFSDHHLNENLPRRAHWQALKEPAETALAAIEAILEGFTPSSNERQTEDDLVVPVLRLLGHTFEVQAALQTADGTKKPDYVFYQDAQAVVAHKNQVLTDALPHEGGIAVGDAKYWGRPLDTAMAHPGKDALSNKNPSFQICFYVQQSAVSWGILTNGKQWRLYHKDTAHKFDCFYEVDLEELVQSGDVGRFLYFYAFFRREAFDDGPLSLAEILRESADYAQSVGNGLKDQVYDALRHIAQGFLDYAPNSLKTEPETLKTIYDNSLILLYRMLFILYAEARDLLPVKDSRQYRDTYSLHAIKRAVAQDLKTGRDMLADSALLWPRLQQLFDIINLGSPPLKVATFNGGLFDPNKHAFLAQNTVGDAHLQQAIDKLARVGGAFVDYRDLTVRHMGTIYEGLLEYRLQPLTAPEDGWIVELVNDKGERKATGSYYTPDYIVKYIVEQTVGPVLEKAVEDKASDADRLKAVLEVNVLDPAMGSGHFLVEATEYIARFLVDLGVLPEGKTQEEADMAFWKRRVAQACIYGVDLNPLAVELAKLSLWLITVAKDRPLSFLDHHLRPGNSLVGARLEHLEPGAALKKSKKRRKTEEAEAAGQVSQFGDGDFTQRVRTAVGSMWLIEENEASSVEQVKEQERLYEGLRKELVGKYARLLNMVTATHFGLGVDAWMWSSLIKYASGSNAAALPAFEKLLRQADETAARERFFHWELEFPEIYFDRYGRALGEDGGFEAVIGNPPYVRQEQLGAYKAYFERHYAAVSNGVADLYVYFYARGLEELQQGGLLGYISSGTFRRLRSGEGLRKHLSTQSKIEEISEFGEQQVFDGAVTYPVIVVLRRRRPNREETFRLIQATPLGVMAERCVEHQVPSGDEPWVFLSGGIRRIVDGVDGTIRLAQAAAGRIRRGLTTGLNEAFVMSERERDELVRMDPGCKDVLKPFIRGENLHPWHENREGQWLITLPCGWTRATLGEGMGEKDAWLSLSKRHPGIANRLAPFATQANERWDKGEYWWELRPCDYYTVFELPRIYSTKVSLHPAFSLSDEVCYAGNTAYIIPVSSVESGHYLLGLLNSRVCEFFCRTVFSPKANGYYEIQPDGLGRMPVPSGGSSDTLAVGDLAKRASEVSRKRRHLHDSIRHRLQSDLGTAGKKLNQKLTAWWELDFAGLRAELGKVFKTDIAVGERDDWEKWFDQQRAEHVRLTDEIIALETELNERVYALFELTADEIKLIEESTKYKYGEV